MNKWKPSRQEQADMADLWIETARSRIELRTNALLARYGGNVQAATESSGIGISFGFACDIISALDHAIAEIRKLREEISDQKTSVIAFGAAWAVEYARTIGLSGGALHPTHYDLLAKAGARMEDFTRGHEKS